MKQKYQMPLLIAAIYEAIVIPLSAYCLFGNHHGGPWFFLHAVGFPTLRFSKYIQDLTNLDKLVYWGYIDVFFAIVVGFIFYFGLILGIQKVWNSLSYKSHTTSI